MAQGRRRGAGASQIIGFFTTASEAARGVVTYFQNAEPAEAEAALAVASAIVKDKRGDQPMRTRTKREPAQGTTAAAAQPQGGTRTMQAGSTDDSAKQAAPSGDRAAQGKARVIGGAGSSGGGAVSGQ